ncbi:hypothetical protein GFS60_07925 (plasmid) [Rhodococcus sp. WAY2]|nr:hypothetical protein GFS60_07925 [Rhodococcus sp. WAY2]
MMYWYGSDPGGWGYALMIIGMVLFWGLLITGVVMLARYVGREASSPTHLPVLHTAEQVLAERFARGELDETEYRSRLATLRGQAPQ